MPKIFTNHEQIKEALFKLSFLDYRERQVVYDELVEKLSGDGVTRTEFIEVIRRLRREKLITEVAEEHLLKLADND